MGTGYTRNDTANNIADGNVINAADFDGEYDAIEAAFNSSTGHTHDGTAAEGGPITVLGPNQEFVASASAVAPSTNAGIDIGTASLKFKDLYIDGTAYIDGLGGNLLIDTTNAIQFRDTALSISSSADGQLDIAADTTAKITSPEVIVTDDFRLQSDAAILTFGTDNDVTVTHVADTGLDAQAASGFTLKLQTGDTTVESGNTIGKISFNAPDEASGTDAILVGAEIEAAAEDTFSSTVNSTALVFKTNTSAAATERMRIKSDGDIVLKGASYDFVFDASAHALTTSASNGDLNLTPHGTGTVVVTGDLDVDNINIDGNTISSTDTNGDINITPNGTGTVNITGGIMQDEVNLTSTDAGTAAGPTMDVFRNSASPVDNDLLGNITFTGNDDAANKTTYASIDAAIIDASNGTEDGQLQLKTMVGGTDTAVITLKEGNVGIGVTNPQDFIGGANRLVIGSGSGSQGISIYAGSASNSSVFFVDGDSGTSEYRGQINYRHDVDGMSFHTAGGFEAMRIDSLQRLLIGGTTSNTVSGYANSLQLQGTLADDAGASITRYTDSSAAGVLTFGKSRSTTVGTAGTVVQDGDALGYIMFAGDDGTDIVTNAAWIIAEVDGTPGSNDMPGRLVFSTTADGAASPTERMRIDSSGNVDIGSTGGGVKLAVAGAVGPQNGSAASPTHTFYSDTNTGMFRAAADTLGFSTAGSEAMRINSSGDVGIGTTNPTGTLNVHTGGVGLRLDANAASGDTEIQLAPKSSASGICNVGIVAESEENGVASALYFKTRSSGGTNSEVVRIDSSGNLLVGKTVASDSAAGVSLRGVNGFEATVSNNIVGNFNRKTSDGDIVIFRKDSSTVGSIRSRGGVVSSIVLDPRTGGGGLGATGPGALCATTNDGSATTDNVLDLGDAGARWKDVYVGGGVYLGGTGSANKLTDYEEGSWTPTIGSGSFTATNARYVKVGDMVTVCANLADITDNTSTSDVQISGLPFATVAASQTVGSVMFRYINAPSNRIQLTPLVNASSTTMIFYWSSSTGATWDGLRYADASFTNWDMIISITYRAAG